MQNILSIVRTKVSTKVLVLGFIAIAATLALAPRSIEQTRAESCTIIQDPTFNPFPVTFGGTAGTGCTDFPVVAVRPINSTPNDYSSSLSAQSGDEFYVRIYVHNGAAQGLDPNHTTMNNVTATTNISGGSINVNLAAGATNDGYVPASIGGSASINLPDGATLQVEPGSGAVYDYTGSQIQSGLIPDGTVSLGSQQACFEFSRQILFKVKVIGGQQATPTASINASLGTQISGQCLWTGTVNWQTTNVNNVRVYVKSQNSGNVEQLAWATPSGNETVNYIDPNDLVTYILRGDGIADQVATINSAGLSCGNNNPAPTPTYSISAQLGTQIAGQCMWTGTVTWNTSNVNNVRVYVKSQNNTNGSNTETLAYAAASGNETVNYIDPNDVVTFILRGDGIPDQVATINSNGLSCGNNNPAPTPTYSITASLGSQISGQCLWTGHVSWNTSNVNNVRVYVKSVNSGFEQLAWATPSGNETVNYIDPNDLVTYTLRGDGIPDQVATINSNGLSCGGNNPPTQVNGVCGSSNGGTFSSAPTSGLCSVGSPSSVTGSGPWNWSCSGSNGGSPAYCSASQTQQGPTCQVPTSGTITAPTNVNPYQTFSVSCDFGVANAFIPAPADMVNSNTNCSFTGYNGTAANFSCIAPASGAMTFMCQIQNKAGYANVCNSAQVSKIVYVNSQNNPQPNPLSCVASKSGNIHAGDSVTYTASGGTGTGYGFTVLDINGTWKGGYTGSPSTITYNLAPGTYHVNLTDSSAASVNCGSITIVPVNNSQPTPLTCVASRSGQINVGTAVTYTASGGTGTGYGFTALTDSGAYVTGAVGSPATITYNTPGSFHVNLTDSSLASVNCGPVTVVTTQVPTLQCSPVSSTVNAGSSVNFVATGGTGSYSWNASNGQTGNGATFNSVFNQSGSATVTSGSQTASCSVTVNQAPVYNPVICSPKSQSAQTNQLVSFAATGGNGSFSWSGSNLQSNFGGSATAIYSNGGTYSVTVTDGRSSDTCTVTVATPVTPTLQCSPTSRTVDAGTPVSFNATGGNGSYSWSSTNGQSGSGSGFSTVFTQSGSATVTSGSQTATCSVTVNQVPVQTQSFTVNVNNFCVNTNATYQFTGTANLSGLSVNAVTSASPSGSQNNGVIGSMQSGNGLSSLFVTGKLWTTADIGHWTRTFTIGNATQTVNFDVINCNPPTQTTLTCTPGNQTINGAQTVQFTANGGNGTYAWTTSNGQTSNGQSFSATFSQSGTATVTSGGQTATCGVTLAQQPSNTNGGNCNNSSNSCNNNTNNTTQNQGNNNVNSSNQNNNVNNNGNNNTITNTNNNCVNNSCNVIYYYVSNSTAIPANQYRQLDIRKLVRVANTGSFQKSVSVNSGDIVEFQITVTNSGNQPVNNVVLSDGGINGLAWQGATYVNGNSNYNWNGNNLNLGNLAVGQTATVTFQARVTVGCGGNVQNIASVTADSIPQRQDDAWVFANQCGSSGNVNLSLSKRAINNTKNADATSVYASKEDYITYTLTVTNNGNQPANNFVVTDDLSQVLPYADMVDRGGGSLNGSIITYPAQTVPAGGSISVSFQVRVKFFLANNLSYTMTNTYGNTVVIHINTPQVTGTFVAPKTGADTDAFAFGGILMAGYALFKKKEFLMKLVLN